MMFYVWTNWYDKDKRLRVAGADNFSDAVYYGSQYADEGPVTIKEGNTILGTLDRTYPSWMIGGDK